MIRKLTTATALALLALATPAAATHVQCGATITQDTTLDSDIQCGPNQINGLIIGASNVKLRLAGHTIRAHPSRSEEGYGIGNPYTDPLASNIHITNGAIEGFYAGVGLIANDSAVRNLNISSTTVGMQLGGDRMLAHRNLVHITTPASPIGSNPPGIDMIGDDPYAWRNVITGVPGAGIIVQGERARAVFNEIRSCDPGSSTVGIHADLYFTRAVINRNTVSGCDDGVVATGEDSTGGARVRLNTVTGGTRGFRIRDPNAIIGRNIATGASQDGIHIELAGTTVQYNTANDNGRYGIFGPVGTIDGGGNTASGNGASPQCVNVQCGGP